MLIRQVKVNGLPVLEISANLKGVEKCFGAKYIPERHVCLFPLFYPFRDKVLQEVAPYIQHLELYPILRNQKIKDLDTWKHEVSLMAFPTKSREHQIEGLAELLYNNRWALQWDMGTGKTKVCVDYLSLTKQKALVICPLVAMDNWKNELEKHAAGELSVFLLNGPTKKEKREGLIKALDYDILVATYDSVRLYGSPVLFPETAKAFMRAMVIPNAKIKNDLMQVVDKDKQLQYAVQLIEGRKPSEICADIAQYVGTNPLFLQQLPYTTIIFDESHRFKRLQSKRTDFCIQLAAKARNRYLLSGTMSTGDPRDLYPQLKALAPYLMPEKWEVFCRKFTITRGRNIVVGFRNLDEINMRSTLVSSTKKLEECVDVPERTFIEISYELSQEQLAEYNRVATELRLWHNSKDDEIELSNPAVGISKALQICSGFSYVPGIPDPNKLYSSQDNDTVLRKTARETQRFSKNAKLEKLKDLLEDLVGGQGSKTIIWANFIAELDDIEALLKSEGYRYIRVDGTNSKDIQTHVNTFQNDKDVLVYLAQVSTGISVNLTASKYSVYYSRTWNPDAHRQSLYRNYRMGQRSKTIVYFLVGKNTAEKQQLYALDNRKFLGEILTQRPNCMVCSEYSKCIEKGVKPWSTDCVLDSTQKRMVTRLTPLEVSK